MWQAGTGLTYRRILTTFVLKAVRHIMANVGNDGPGVHGVSSGVGSDGVGISSAMMNVRNGCLHIYREPDLGTES